MKKTYKIEVDCANCAAKMEDAANTVSGVVPQQPPAANRCSSR